VYAFREAAPGHALYRRWLLDTVSSDQAFGMAELALAGFLRIVTHPQIFDPPTKLSEALEFADTLRHRPNCVPLRPGERHWEIFARLCRAVGAKGNLIPDAYLAALAMESGSEFITADRGYARFPGLRWRHPLDS
jgi:hypothetical protein